VACRIISCGEFAMRVADRDVLSAGGSSTWQVLRFMLLRSARRRLMAPLRSSNSATFRSSAARCS